MYMRFTTPYAAAKTRGARHGIFGPAYWVWRDGSQPDWLRAAIRDDLDWFNDHLPVPYRFGVVTRKSHRPYGGVCWFRDDAGAMIDRARRIAALLDQAGVPVTRLRARAPGDIVYRDPWQVVAMPRRA
ncbi:MAG: hypothetical protein AAGJ87_05210 [Pseudomonadota bacterium]